MVLSLVGCGRDGTEGPGGTQAIGERCDSFRRCADGECSSLDICTRECSSDADCGALACGWLEGIAQCVPRCDTDDDAPFNAVCEAGKAVACDEASSDKCSRCGCEDGLRCDTSTDTCMPLSDLGGFCERDRDCRTNNCSVSSNVCRVPVGDPCTSDNCDRCLRSDNGWSFCSRECGDPLRNNCNGHLCLGSRATDFFTCRPRCAGMSDASCPGTCRFDADFENLFCDCPSADCPIASAPRSEGEWCRAPSECSLGVCYSRRECGGILGDECISLGWCAADGCDGGCAAGTTCATIPCIGTAATCGTRCLPTCETTEDCRRRGLLVGHCRDVTSPTGAPARVCDVKLPDASACRVGDDCQSGSCAGGRCAPAGGAANGQPCNNNGDCASNRCISAQCRGAGVIGDACTVDADCSVGRCCPGGPNAGTCQSGC